MDEVVYVGHGDGIGWVGMVDEEHEKGCGTTAHKRPSSTAVTMSLTEWEGTSFSLFC